MIISPFVDAQCNGDNADDYCYDEQRNANGNEPTNAEPYQVTAHGEQNDVPEDAPEQAVRVRFLFLFCIHTSRLLLEGIFRDGVIGDINVRAVFCLITPAVPLFGACRTLAAEKLKVWAI